MRNSYLAVLFPLAPEVTSSILLYLCVICVMGTTDTQPFWNCLWLKENASHTPDSVVEEAGRERRFVISIPAVVFLRAQNGQ